MTEYGGSASSTVKMRCDYTPFGKQIAVSGTGYAIP
jgi:hypothetical protein